MAISLRAHFDGRHLIPDEPVTLPMGQVLHISIDLTSSVSERESPFTKLLAIASKVKVDSNIPKDAAARHDEYLYGSSDLE